MICDEKTLIRMLRLGIKPTVIGTLLLAQKRSFFKKDMKTLEGTYRVSFFLFSNSKVIGA
jgi:hypothetical protein